MMNNHPLALWLPTVLVPVAVLWPYLADWLGLQFSVSLLTRVLIYAIAANGLNLVLGYGGLLSFGHAAFLGAGGYGVAILSMFGISAIWIAFPTAIVAAALLAVVIGVICLRTHGLSFIMITLAFAQMAYYVLVSLKFVGGDDGLPLAQKTVVASGITLANPAVMYWATLAGFLLTTWIVHRLDTAPFGRALAAVRDNETRAGALGIPVFRVKLLCFVVGGAMAGLAGALLANLNAFITPSTLHWIVSGTLMIMVILGGSGRLWGGLIGAALVQGIEEIVSPFTLHWPVVLAIVILAVALLFPQGVMSFVKRVQQ
jgi:branched-chain amino acid transport system permease protein